MTQPIYDVADFAFDLELGLTVSDDRHRIDIFSLVDEVDEEQLPEGYEYGDPLPPNLRVLRYEVEHWTPTEGWQPFQDNSAGTLADGLTPVANVYRFAVLMVKALHDHDYRKGRPNLDLFSWFDGSANWDVQRAYDEGNL